MTAVANWTVFSPHPPLLIPEIGGDMLKQVTDTQRSLQKVFSEVEEVDTVIVITPHGFAARNSLSVIMDDCEGRLINFGGKAPLLNLETDKALADEIVQISRDQEISVNTVTKADTRRGEELLDHGSYVPLYYALEQLKEPQILLINPGLLSPNKLWDLGKKFANIFKKYQENGKNIGIIISGDLSHSLSYTAPGGYHPEAFKFDQAIESILQNQQLSELLNLSEGLLENAAECGYRPLVLGSSISDQGITMYKEVLSYEAPFGVGYLVARLV